MATTRSFATTTRGLRRDIPPMRLWEKAKRLGVWDPAEIDFTQDVKDWKRLSEKEQGMLLRLTSQFQAGEEAVTLDLLPLIEVIASEGRIEEEMFLTTFLWEEAKHVDFFHRFIDEVVGDSTHSLNHHLGECYNTVFQEALPNALNALRTDPSPAAQVRASATYNLIVEGVLAETGYYTYYAVLDTHKILPGQRKGIGLLKQDEARHIAYGIYLLSRLMAEDESLWEVVEQTMNELLPPCLGMISESFAVYGDPPPFDLKEDDFNQYAMSQFEKRLDRVRRARGMSLEQVYAETAQVIEDDDA